MSKLIQILFILFSHLTVLSAASNLGINWQEEQNAQQGCIQQFVADCLSKCEKSEDNNCIQLCSENAKNQCRQAGE